MANVGTAYVNVVPKFGGFSAAVKSELARAASTSGATGAAMGTAMGTGLKGGLAKAGAIAGVVSSLASSAIGAVTSQIGSAVRRFDTLNQYPRVMQSLGYAADDADASIGRMSDRLQGLPTALDTMASTVQGLTAITGDLSKATDIGLAVNDMLIAGGASTQMANSALEQFRQVLSKGKPEVQDWRTLVQAMPGQMDQLAKSMLGPTANANDLYHAIGGGMEGEWDGPTFTLDEFCDQIVRLDQEGGEGITSFMEQAQAGSQGVATSMENVKTAVGRGLAGIMDEFGEERFTGLFSGLKAGVDEGFSFLRENVVADLVPVADRMAAAFDKVAPGLKDALAGLVTSAKDLAVEAWEAFEPIVPKVSGVVEGVMGVVSSAMDGIAPYMDDIAGIVGGVSDAVSGVLSAVEPVADKVLIAYASFKVFSGVAGILTPVVTGIGGIATALSSGAGLAGGLGSAIATALGFSSPAGLAVTVICGLLAGIATAFITGKEEAENYEKATEGMDGTIGQLRGLQGYKTQVDELNGAMGDTAKNLSELSEANANRVDTITGIISGAKEELGDLSAAWEIIEEFAGKTDLSAEQAGQVAWAAEKVGEATGVQLDAAGVAAGIYKDEQGAAHDLVTELGNLVQAKLYSIELDALTKTYSEQKAAVDDAAASVAKWQSVYDENYALMYSQELAACGDSAEAAARAQDRATAAADRQVGSYQELNGELSSSKWAAKGTAEELGRLTSVTNGTADAWTKLGVEMSRDEDFALAKKSLEESGRTMYDFLDTLGMYGVSVEDAQKLTGEQMETLARHYDGTVASIAGDLDTFGVHLDESAQNVHALADALNGAIQGLGPGTSETLQGLGVDTFEFADALAQAGVQTETLSEIGGANISALAVATQGDIGVMVAAIASYNGTPILDKEGNVTADVSSLVDAQGNVYTWNGTQLVDKDGNVVVDDVELVDAQGNVVVWNGTTLKSKSASANVGTNIPSVLGYITAYNNRVIRDKYGTVTITTRHVQVGRAGTGVRAVEMATGGIRMHADGFIANKATWLGPNDIVGEAGSEAVVPLTNRQYAMPFVKMIADEVNKKSGGETVNYNLSLNGLTVNDDARIRGLSKALVEELVRKGAM